jgi:hypothetical protein
MTKNKQQSNGLFGFVKKQGKLVCWHDSGRKALVTRLGNCSSLLLNRPCICRGRASQICGNSTLPAQAGSTPCICQATCARAQASFHTAGCRHEFFTTTVRSHERTSSVNSSFHATADDGTVGRDTASCSKGPEHAQRRCSGCLATTPPHAHAPAGHVCKLHGHG